MRQIASPRALTPSLTQGTVSADLPAGGSLAITGVATGQGCSGAGTRWDGVPHFFDRGARPPLPPLFGLKFVQKLVHCCNWLLTETQCKIILVQHVCRPKLFKKPLSKSCFRRPPFLFRTTPLLGAGDQHCRELFEICIMHCICTKYNKLAPTKSWNTVSRFAGDVVAY